MTQTKRVRIAALALICATIAGKALAGSPQVLTPADAQSYARAFESVDRGDFIDATMQTLEISDPSLSGYITYRGLMHPTAHKSNFEELSGWLARYADLPVAERIYTLASKRKTPDMAAPAVPGLIGTDWNKVELVAPGSGGPFDLDNARLAREAFYSGDSRRALDLAKAVGERWIAGMAAYRLRRYDQAETHLSQVAQDTEEDIWVRAGAAYWAARAAEAGGASDRAATYLRQAAGSPETFYGMIAERQVALGNLGPAIPLSMAQPYQPRARSVIKASYGGPTADVTKMMREDVRAHRAAALAQIGRVPESGQELRAGLALARTPEERQRWLKLAAVINEGLAQDMAAAGHARRRGEPDYPTPNLNPREGFKVSKALVYAIVRQESRFNPGVVSPAGAVGLMQLMPDAAAHATGDKRLRDDMSPLFDPSFNLKVGQDYLGWLMGEGVGYDILRTVAAYNGGPGTLQKTATMLGEDDESLMVIECMPAVETRNYVERVMAAYWTYQKKFGQESRTLDALATGQKYIDARWDAPLPAAKVVVAEDEDAKASPKADKQARRGKRG
ncbi:MAG: lytic transglycosylase domain-containing protein [Phenylobacterium sp.]|uniref:lytic transglycosylase domain-containing protein n=1 Tax=Phenylobacterium sp. TaxID=1871053 RepID=UPI001B55295C|nr:lytic transglycosylase domain-containing protein [Phenylobacterium sp.]MBP7815953.1 lytic transglycosylase domain-containing protein [Phenylobacterium sp.]